MGIYSKIVCATDFSAGCPPTVYKAAELARMNDAALTLLHVVDRYPVTHSNQWIEPEGRDPGAYQEEQARELLAELSREMDGNMSEHEVRYTSKGAKDEIIRFAEEQGSDLIIVASHGKQSIWPVPGSTTHTLANQAPCDVLVVRQAD